MQALSGLILRREAGDARAREALAVVVEVLSEMGEQDEVSDLLAYARAHQVMPVARLLERPGPARTFRIEEEISVDRAMREQTLGYRKQLARTASRQELIRLLGDPDPEVVRKLLTHPKLRFPGPDLRPDRIDTTCVVLAEVAALDFLEPTGRRRVVLPEKPLLWLQIAQYLERHLVRTARGTRQLITDGGERRLGIGEQTGCRHGCTQPELVVCVHRPTTPTKRH